MSDSKDERENEEDEEMERMKKQQQLNGCLFDAIIKKNDKELKRLLLEEGASPDSTCPNTHVSACHLAARVNWEALRVLLWAGADRHRKDKDGLTPLHYAAVAQGPRRIAMLLDFPEDLQYKTAITITPETLEEIKAFKPLISPANMVLLNTPIKPENQDILDDQKVEKEHDCKNTCKFSGFCDVKLNWTPLHIASTVCDISSLQVLLAAGADPNIKDKRASKVCKNGRFVFHVDLLYPSDPDTEGYTALDLAGHSIRIRKTHSYYEPEKKKFLKTINSLIEFGGKLETNGNKCYFNSVLHTAIINHCPEAFPVLIDAGAPPTIRDESGDTAIRRCEVKNFEEYGKTLIKIMEDRKRKQEEESRVIQEPEENKSAEASCSSAG